MKYWLIAVSSAVNTSLSSSMISGVDCMAGRLSGLLAALAGQPADSLERLQELDRDREDDGRVLLGRDLHHRLELAELEGAGGGGHDHGRLAQLDRRLQLALGGDDLGPPLPPRL